MATIYHTDGSRKKVYPKTLNDFKKLLTCTQVEFLFMDNNILVFMDFNRRRRIEPVKNVNASAIIKQPVYGDVIIADAMHNRTNQMFNEFDDKILSEMIDAKEHLDSREVARASK